MKKSYSTSDAPVRTLSAEDLLDLIASKWTSVTLAILSEGSQRFGELEKQMDGISAKMLAQTLRRLEASGLVHRKVYPVVPPRVEYRLTSQGETLHGLLRQVNDWAFEHAEQYNAEELEESVSSP